jgi:hypothetical protein
MLLLQRVSAWFSPSRAEIIPLGCETQADFPAIATNNNFEVEWRNLVEPLAVLKDLTLCFASATPMYAPMPRLGPQILTEFFCSIGKRLRGFAPNRAKEESVG